MRDYSDLDPSDYTDPSPQEQAYYDYNYIDDKLYDDESKAENYMEWLKRDMSIDGYRREDALDFLLIQFDKAITPVLSTIDDRLGNKLKEFDLSKFVNAYFDGCKEYVKNSIEFEQKHKSKIPSNNGKTRLYSESEIYLSNRLFECACNQIGLAELIEEQLKLKDNQLLATMFNQVNKYNVNEFLYKSPDSYGDKTAKKEPSFRQLLINGVFEDLMSAYENPVSNDEWIEFLFKNSEIAEKIVSESKIDLVVNGENKQLTLGDMARLVVDAGYNNEQIDIKAISPERNLEQASGLTL